MTLPTKTVQQIAAWEALPGLAEQASEALAKSGHALYIERFAALPGLEDGEEVEIVIRRMHPITFEVLEVAV